MSISDKFAFVKDALNAERTFAVAKTLTGLSDGTGREHNQPCPICNAGDDRFYYRSSSKTFHCRQCSFTSGDIIRLVAEVNSTGMWSALTKIADGAGITLETTQPVKAAQPIKAKQPTEPATAIPPLDEGYTEHLHRKFGKPDVTYCYKNIDGEEQYQILRWNATEQRDKIIRPDRKGLTVHNRTPLCLDKLVDADAIVICEGEKATNRFNLDYENFLGYRSDYIRYTATTAGACSYAEVFRRSLENPENRNAFWNCFTGKPKPVLVFVDNDEAGYAGAAAVADVFRSFGFEPKIYTLPFCGGAAADYADYSANHFSEDGVGQPIEALFELEILTNEGGKF